MRILVLGAGAIGGYFGGRLAEGGADVTFLVRPRRKAELDASGLIVKSVKGDIALRPQTLEGGARAEPFDIVLLACKSYDLEAAIDAIAPYMGEASAVLPLLNGLSHLDRLKERLGAARVMGGACFIGAALEPNGVVRHIGDMQTLVFGELTRERSARAEALAAAFARTKVAAQISPDIVQAMWEKLVLLAALVAVTGLARGTVGEVAAAHGTGFALAALAECEAAAAAEGHASGESARGQARRLLTTPSPFAASAMRDLVAGRRTEGDHIVGDLARRAQKHGLPHPILEAARIMYAVHEARL
jgi:2-dehydropantoate 2-reductase